MGNWKQNILLFDLDGTLTDSAEGILRSAQYMQKKMGMRVWSESELAFMIGPPLTVSFGQGMGMSETQVQQAISYFRERYFDVGLFENKVYDNIPETLSALRKQGKRLAVATSKHQSTAQRILDHFGLTPYFEVIGGDAPGGGRTDKQKVVAYVLEQMQAKKDDVVMIGDRKYDIEGAHALGIPAIGVLYGYGSQAEFDACQADVVVHTPQELLTLFGI